MSCVDKKFWLENLGALFSSIQLVPTKHMNSAQQLNSITRTVLFLFIIMLLFNFRYSIHFLIISLIFIIIIYYIQKNNMKENFEPTTYAGPSPNTSATKIISSTNPLNLKNLTQTSVFNKVNPNKKGIPMQQTIIESPIALPFCNDGVSIDPPSEIAVNINQQLVGVGNPKTKIKPVIVPPSHDLSYWKDTDFVEYSQINRDNAQQDMYLSGYAESTCCGYLPEGSSLQPFENKKEKVVVGGGIPPFTENYNPEYPGYNYPNLNYPKVGGYSGKNPIVSPVPTYDTPFVPTIGNKGVANTNYSNKPITQSQMSFYESYNSENSKDYPGYNYPELNYPKVGGYSGKNPIVSPVPTYDTPFVPTIGNKGVATYNPNTHYVVPKIVENYENMQDGYGSLKTVNNPDFAIVQNNQPGWVNTSCGYNPEQVFTAGLPSNLPVGNCQQNSTLKRYNENLATQFVGPDIYTRSQINEPINSMIGISFQQQFEPVTCNRNDKGLEYIQHDPRIIEPAIYEPIEIEEKARYDNITDPRFYGYGTSYRSYLEPVTGQPRFFYDDINAIRMPNYIVRSKVDHLPYEDSYGPVQEKSEFGNVHNPNIRALVQDSWLRNSLQFRDDISERTMRKNNIVAAQKRQAPLLNGKLN